MSVGARFRLLRLAAIVLLSSPAVGMAVFIAARRQTRVEALLTGWSLAALLGGGAAVAAALAVRRPLLRWIDRRDPLRTDIDGGLARDTVRRLRSARTVEALADELCQALEETLGVEHAALLVRRETFRLDDPRRRLRPLEDPALLALLGSTDSVLAVEHDRSASPWTRLPDSALSWIADTDASLLTPVLARDGDLAGVLLVGPPPGRDRWSRREHSLLRDVAVQAAPLVEELIARSRETVEPATISLAAARECPGCATVHPPETAHCPSCGQSTDETAVPFVLLDRFRFVERIGTGGMGLVYRAHDLQLDRSVAVKTLPRVTSLTAARLRREARVLAAVSHPHLATIFGFETWQGTPMLVLEYLSAGILIDRVNRSPLDAEETIELGLSLVGGLATLHDSGILHRDVKPSNVGYTPAGIPKLLDFGIARFQIEPDEPDEPSEAGSGSRTEEAIELDRLTSTHGLLGTLPYLAPEILTGSEPSTRTDLWALAVVLWEAHAGRNAIESDDAAEQAEMIREARIPELRAVAPDCPPELSDFFRRALHRDPTQRPQSTAEFEAGLRAVRTEAGV